MKVVALMPVKNDAWILRTTIPQLKIFVDDILCLDGFSEDNTLEVLKEFNVKVKTQSGKETNYSKWRNELLDWGRNEGGTHFVWLDADEAFTSNFLPIFKDTLEKMKPGEKLAMNWLCLWKDYRVYRNDNSIWSNLYKDFIFCDDDKSSFGNTLLHEGRTPNSEIKEWTKLPLEKGSVLHFQFVPFKKFQIKQAFQRCREYVAKTGSVRRINNKYSETLDKDDVKLKDIPKEWLSGIIVPKEILTMDDIYYKKSIMNFFKEYGVKYFEPLEIWHLDELKKIFIEKLSREPKIKKYPKILIEINKIKNKVKNICNS
ncbi:MAG: glycosyltransferase [bacterium]|nr:glycosyltransferase [bacterium]